VAASRSIRRESMKRNLITIRGIKFTKSELENALKEINAKVHHLDGVVSRNGGGRGVVLVGGYVQRTYAAKAEMSGQFTVVAEDGSGFTFDSEEVLLRVWRLENDDTDEGEEDDDVERSL
jgi:hypothetical protein